MVGAHGLGCPFCLEFCLSFFGAFAFDDKKFMSHFPCGFKNPLEFGACGFCLWVTFKKVGLAFIEGDVASFKIVGLSSFFAAFDFFFELGGDFDGKLFCFIHLFLKFGVIDLLS